MKILVVDDHTLIREGMRHVLQRLGDDVTVLEARDCAAALGHADENEDLDLVLLDLGLPGLDGFAVLALLRERHPAAPVVIVSASADPDDIAETVERGASGFIPKSFSGKAMLDALRAVLAGEIFFPAEIPALAAIEHPAKAGAFERVQAAVSAVGLNFTERQIQVFTLMIQGKSNRVICEQLDLAEGTVKVHVSAILKKMKVASRTQAVLLARELGLKPQKNANF